MINEDEKDDEELKHDKDKNFISNPPDEYRDATTEETDYIVEAIE